jgi:hypothetical protein
VFRRFLSWLLKLSGSFMARPTFDIDFPMATFFLWAMYDEAS